MTTNQKLPVGAPTPHPRTGFVTRQSMDLHQEMFRELVAQHQALKQGYLKIKEENRKFRILFRKLSIKLDKTNQT